MNLVGALFGRKTDPSVAVDFKSTKYFKSQNLDRCQFSIDVVSKIKWWPDEIVVFLDIIKLSYIDFISGYEMSEDFDEPMRDAIFYMLKETYAKARPIAKFIQYNDQSIPKHYVGYMFVEDNCRMYDLDDRFRSKNDQKHSLLVKAVTQLLKQTPVQYERYQLGAKQEAMLRKYLIIYNLRKCYAAVDDMLRNILQAVFRKIPGVTDLMLILEELIAEFQETVVTQLRYADEKLLNKVYTLHDLLSYAMMRMQQCDLVFNKPTLGANPFPERRVTYVFKYFRDLADHHNKKIEISRSSQEVMKISEAELAKREQELRMIAPRYFLSDSSLRDDTPSDRDSKTKTRSESDGPNPRGFALIPDTDRSTGVGQMSESGFVVTLDTPVTVKKVRAALHRRQSTVDFILRKRNESERTERVLAEESDEGS